MRKSLQSSPLCDSLWLSQLEMQRKLCLYFSVCFCVCLCLCVHCCIFLPGLHWRPGNKKQCFSLKSDPAFYRVELLIADNPAAPPTPCLGHTPSLPLLPSSPPLLFSVFTSPPSLSLVLSLPFFQSSPPSFTPPLASCDGAFPICRRCVVLCW